MKKPEKTPVKHTKSCTLCKKSFSTADKRFKLCPNCKIQLERNRKEKIYDRKRKARQRALAGLTVNEILNLTESYNKRHKTCFSYGKFMAYAENGLIETEELINDIRPA